MVVKLIAVQECSVCRHYVMWNFSRKMFSLPRVIMDETRVDVLCFAARPYVLLVYAKSTFHYSPAIENAAIVRRRALLLSNTGH